MSEFEQDLQLWEIGARSPRALAARYPRRDIEGILALHGTLRTSAAEPVPAPAWDAVRDRLGAQSPAPVVALRIRRPLVAAVAAAVLALGTVAYAFGPEPFRRGVDRVIDAVGDLFGDGEEAPAPVPTRSPPERDGAGEDEPRDDGRRNRGLSGDRDDDDREDEDEDDEDDRRGSNTGSGGGGSGSDSGSNDSGDDGDQEPEQDEEGEEPEAGDGEEGGGSSGSGSSGSSGSGSGSSGDSADEEGEED